MKEFVTMGNGVKRVTEEVMVSIDWAISNMESSIETFQGNKRQEEEMYNKLDDLFKKAELVRCFFGRTDAPKDVIKMANEFIRTTYWGIIK